MNIIALVSYFAIETDVLAGYNGPWANETFAKKSSENKGLKLPIKLNYAMLLPIAGHRAQFPVTKSL